MKTFKQYLTESANSINFDMLVSVYMDQPKVKFSINDVKQWLVTVTGTANWTDFLHRCKFGQCDSIAGLVASHFQNVDVYECKSLDPNPFNHFINRCGNVFYDFGKGTIRGIVDGQDLNVVTFNKKESQALHVDEAIKRFYFCRTSKEYVK